MKTKTSVEYLDGRKTNHFWHDSRQDAEAFAVKLSKGANVHCVTVHTVYIDGKKEG